YNNSLYFRSQRQLWRTDGTPTGTSLFSNLTSPGGFTIYNGRLYFEAASPAEGMEMRSTDGTPAGTTLLKEIAPGTRGIEYDGYATPSWIFNGRLYFRADDVLHGSEMWSTDGTSA